MSELSRDKPAVFLDRDGTINLDCVEYITTVENFQLLEGVGQALRRLQAAGYLLVVVTNQACLGKGLLNEQGLKKIHDHMEQLLGEEGVNFDGIYFCPEHPEAIVEKYLPHSNRRKPEPGMILEAGEDLSIDLSKSWMIGDSQGDVQAGKSAGCQTILLTESKPSKEQPNQSADTQQADFTAENLLEAAEIVIQQDIGSDQDQQTSTKKPLRQKPTKIDSRQVLSDILRELRHQRIAPQHREFSITKMLAGIVQCGVLLCLVLAYVAFSYWSGQALLVFLMIGLTLQMMVVALLLVHRSN
jgi:D-glycero-D-manno-heptose 1,7-bisphosphate phosphatase